MVEMPFEVCLVATAKGAFDFVRLTPHFAQDDRGGEYDL